MSKKKALKKKAKAVARTTSSGRGYDDMTVITGALLASGDLLLIRDVSVAAPSVLGERTITLAEFLLALGLQGAVRVYREVLTDPSADTVTITHDLGVKYVTVTVYDENDMQILMDEVTLTDENSLIIEKATYGAVTGDWTVVVTG